VYSTTASYVDAGTFSVYAATQPAHLDEVVTLIRSEVESIVRSGLTADELEVAKGYVAGSFVLGLESPTSRMARLAEHLSIYGRVLSVDEELARYRAVTADDIARVAHEVLGQAWSAAAVGPVSLRRLRSLLA
jgi:predicted Zn-dependent peptidase